MSGHSDVNEHGERLFKRLNREDAKDAKFLSEPGAGRKELAGFGSGKEAHACGKYLPFKLIDHSPDAVFH